MKILVTGAAGDIGSHLTPALIEKGHTIRALVKNASEADRIRMPGVEIFIADITDPRTLDGAAIGIDAAYHLAAALFVVDPEEKLRKINYEGTINVADECIDKGVKRFIFPSFPLVLGPHELPLPPIPPEEATVQPNTYHALYKKLAELHLRTLNSQDKIAVTVLRLGTVYGADIRLIKTLKTFIQRGLYRIPGTGDNISHFAHIDDVVQAMLLVLRSEKAEGRIYNVADDMPVRYKDFVFELADLMGAPRPGFAPVWVFRVLATLSTAWARVVGTTPLINNDIVTFSISSFAADITKTRDELGFRPKYPTTREGLSASISTRVERRRSTAA
ncbi:MAG TPA: NAD(P)-dependent oxidoreductase [Anaerolineae bacterium]|nr:NAD(P)-dependent oxidoreductase [Anaerolineae bacterium]